MTSTVAYRVWATGLACLTCVGITSGVAIRAQATNLSPAPAPTAQPQLQASAAIAGYTPEQLATYKAELDAEALRLKKYRKALVQLSRKLATQPEPGGRGGGGASAAPERAQTPQAPSVEPPAPASAPVLPPEPAPAEAPAPSSDGNTHSS